MARAYDIHGVLTTDAICCYECSAGEGHSEECDGALDRQQGQQLSTYSDEDFPDIDPEAYEPHDLHVDYVDYASAGILSVEPDDGVLPEGAAAEADAVVRYSTLHMARLQADRRRLLSETEDYG